MVPGLPGMERLEPGGGQAWLMAGPGERKLIMVVSLGGGFHPRGPGLGQDSRAGSGCGVLSRGSAGSEATRVPPHPVPHPAFPAWAALRWERNSHPLPKPGLSQEAGDRILVLKDLRPYLRPSASGFLFSESLLLLFLSFLASYCFVLSCLLLPSGPSFSPGIFPVRMYAPSGGVSVSPPTPCSVSSGSFLLDP